MVDSIVEGTRFDSLSCIKAAVFVVRLDHECNSSGQFSLREDIFFFFFLVYNLKSSLVHTVVCTRHLTVNAAASRFDSSVPSDSGFSLVLVCVEIFTLLCHVLLI